MFSMPGLIHVAGYSFAPTGLGTSPRCTHGLRRGLYSYAAPQLTAQGARLRHRVQVVSATLPPPSLLRNGQRPAELFVRW